MGRIILGGRIIPSEIVGKEEFKELEQIVNPFEGEMIFFQGSHIGKPLLAQGRFQEIKIFGSIPSSILRLKPSMYYWFKEEALNLVFESESKGFHLNYNEGKLARLVDCRGRILFESEDEVNFWMNEFEEKLNLPQKQEGAYSLLPGVFALMKTYGIDYHKDLKKAKEKEKERGD